MAGQLRGLLDGAEPLLARLGRGLGALRGGALDPLLQLGEVLLHLRVRGTRGGSPPRGRWRGPACWSCSRADREGGSGAGTVARLLELVAQQDGHVAVRDGAHRGVGERFGEDRLSRGGAVGRSGEIWRARRAQTNSGGGGNSYLLAEELVVDEDGHLLLAFEDAHCRERRAAGHVIGEARRREGAGGRGRAHRGPG